MDRMVGQKDERKFKYIVLQKNIFITNDLERCQGRKVRSLVRLVDAHVIRLRLLRMITTSVRSRWSFLSPRNLAPKYRTIAFGCFLFGFNLLSVRAGRGHISYVIILSLERTITWEKKKSFCLKINTGTILLTYRSLPTISVQIYYN